jgi:hypothetical protein
MEVSNRSLNITLVQDRGSCGGREGTGHVLGKVAVRFETEENLKGFNGD